MEAAQRFLEAKERFRVGSESWGQATAAAYNMLTREECAEVAKPEWWNDEELKALSARVVRAAPNDARANTMRATVLSGHCGTAPWQVEPRSAVEIRAAATHYDRSAALSFAPAAKADKACLSGLCRSVAEAM